MNPPPLEAVHRCRVSVLEAEKTWSLRGEVLWVRTGDFPEQPIPLGSLRKLRLVFAPTRVQRNRFQCHLFNAGGKVAAFQNEHYAGLMSFEDRSGSYRELVVLLVKRTAAANPACEFQTGTAWWNWALQTAFLTGMLALLVVLMIYMGSAVGGLVILKLVIVAVYIPTAWLWIAKNRPRRFSAAEIPNGLLPG